MAQPRPFLGQVREIVDLNARIVSCWVLSDVMCLMRAAKSVTIVPLPRPPCPLFNIRNTLEVKTSPRFRITR